MGLSRQKKFPFSDHQFSKVLRWASRYSTFLFTDGNGYNPPHGAFPRMLFAGKKSYLESDQNTFQKSENYFHDKNTWYYGYFSYELKNEIEKLTSGNPSTVPFRHAGWYESEVVIHISTNEILIETDQDPQDIFNQINASKSMTLHGEQINATPYAHTTKSQYLENVANIKESILRGEFYEANYCMEFSADAAHLDPYITYMHLNGASPMPFSAFLKSDNKYLICASPERFLKKIDNKLISQPIKGTMRRSKVASKDEALIKELQQSEKEQAENLMIVDLVRNDLAKCAIPGSVRVEELFGIYTFPRVHQMISTVSANLPPQTSIPTIIQNTFPMGSMTGAPKIRVMQEMEKLEDTSRGLYSGSVGFISPGQNFDFNVVIRSIVFDAKTGKISFHVGSAITYDSIAEAEYRECLLKAEAMMQVLGIPGH